VKKYVEKSPEKSCTKEKFGAVSHQNCRWPHIFRLVPRPHDEKCEIKFLKFPTPRAHVIVKFLTQGKQVAVKSHGYARYPPPLGQTTDWCINVTHFRFFEGVLRIEPMAILLDTG
jgi:hypothetical protein